MDIKARSGETDFREYLRSFLSFAGLRTVPAVVLLVAVGLTEGVGLLMLIPLLQLIGIGEASPSGVVALVADAWRYVGVPMTLPAVLCVYIAVVALYAAAQRWSTLLNATLAHGFTRFLRNRLFEAMARVEWLQFTKIKGSDINHVLTANLNAVENGTFGLFVLISSAFLIVVHVGVALSLSVPMTLTAMAGSGIVLMVLRPLNRRSYRLGEDWRTTMSDLFAVITEHLGGMKPAKSYGAEERHVRSFQALSGRLENQANRFTGLLTATQMYHDIGGVLALGVFFYVGVEVFMLPAGKLLILVFLFARLAPQFSWMQRTWQTMLNTLPAYGAVEEMHHRFREAQEPIPSVEPAAITLEKAVELRGVSFRYDKDSGGSILNGLGLTLPAFRTTVVLGPSGGGKSTLADVLIGLLKPDTGEVLIDGRALEGDMVHSWRRSVGYVPQESFLFHESIRENLLWAKPDATDADIREALRLASAEEFIDALPEGLETQVGDRGVRLSGGQRQRIALARALLRRPTLLLLDEATSNLDQENERRIIEALEGLRGSMTVVFISHRLSAVRCADHVVEIERGRVTKESDTDRSTGAAAGDVGHGPRKTTGPSEDRAPERECVCPDCTCRGKKKAGTEIAA